MIYVGDRVRVVAHWSAFRGMVGTVTQAKPWIMVRLDGDTGSMRFDESVLERAEEKTA